MRLGAAVQAVRRSAAFSRVSTFVQTADPKTGLVLAFVGLALLIYVATEPVGLLGVANQASPTSSAGPLTPVVGPAAVVQQVEITPSASPTPTAAGSQPTAILTARATATEAIGTPEPPRAPTPRPTQPQPTAAAPSAAQPPVPTGTAPKAATALPMTPTATATVTSTPTRTPTVTSTPTPALPVRFNPQGITWLSSCEATVIRVFLRDKSGNPINGQRFRISTRDGSWSGSSDPTGKVGRFEPGWTGIQLSNNAKAGDWAIWPADDAGLPLSPPFLLTTTSTDCQPGSPGQQIGTIFWTKNF